LTVVTPIAAPTDQVPQPSRWARWIPSNPLASGSYLCCPLLQVGGNDPDPSL